MSPRHDIKARRTLNVASKIQFKVCEVHAVEKKKTLLFETAKRTRSTNPVFLDRGF